jgi:lysophospholipase L1-like esterase
MQKELPVALAVSPKLITVWLVANDFIGGVSYDNYMQDLDTLLKQLHNGTQAKIVMANLPDLTLLPALSKSSEAKKVQVRSEIQRWNTRIAVLANQYNVTQVDLFSHDSQITAHPEYISGDGFHPSPAGYVQLANFFWTAIK